MLIDESLNVWLLEVNASPSLSTTTATDKALKTALIGDVLDIVLPPSFFEKDDLGRGAARRASNAPEGSDPTAGYGEGGADRSGGFELLYDEAVELDVERAKREASGEPTRGRGAKLPGRGRFV